LIESVTKRRGEAGEGGGEEEKHGEAESKTEIICNCLPL